jgi:hypothetical protein
MQEQLQLHIFPGDGAGLTTARIFSICKASSTTVALTVTGCVLSYTASAQTPATISANWVQEDLTYTDY